MPNNPNQPDDQGDDQTQKPGQPKPGQPKPGGR